MRGLEPRARLFPVGDGRFESWDAFTGVWVPVRFGHDTGGAKTLTLGEGAAAVTARVRRRAETLRHRLERQHLRELEDHAPAGVRRIGRGEALLVVHDVDVAERAVDEVET